MPDEVGELIALIRKHGVISKSSWALARGVPSNYFFDADKIAFNSESVRQFSDAYVKKILEIKKVHPEVDRLVFLEKSFGTIGAILLMSSIVSQTGIDATIIRQRKEILFYRLKGTPVGQNNHVIIVSDVLTSGESIEKAARILEGYGAKVCRALVLYDREQDGKKRLETKGIKVETILPKTRLEATGDVPTGPDVPFQADDEIIAPSETKMKEFEEALSPKSIEMLKSARIR